MTHAKRYLYVIALGVCTFTLELAGNWYTNSIGLLSDGLHVAADTTPLVLGFIAVLLRARGYGTSRLEQFTTLCNIGLLLLVGAWIGKETLDRLLHPQEVDTAMLFFALGAVIGNGSQYFLMRDMHGAHAHSHTGRGQVLHLGADFLASAGILLGALALYITGSTLADVGAAALVVLAACAGAWQLIAAFIHEHTHHH